MTLIEAKELLRANSISFEQCEYTSEADYWYHTMMISNSKNAKSCKVVALVIKSKNGHNNLELQFNEKDGDFLFYDLWFGGYSFEKFDVAEEMLADDIIRQISEVQQGTMVFVTVYALSRKGKIWISDKIFDRNDSDDDWFGETGFQKTMRHIQKRKGYLTRLFQIKMQYEIYNWISYQCIIK